VAKTAVVAAAAAAATRQPRSDRFSIFPRASTTLISCASNSGKTWFLRQVLLNRQVFIEDGENVRRVVYVNCNERDSHFSHPWEAEEEKDDDKDDDNSGGDNDDDNDNGKDDDYDDDDDADDDDNNSDGTTDTDADADESNKGKEKNKRDDKNLIDLVSVGLPELAAAAGDGEGLTNLFSPGDVVILDDLQTLTKSVEHLINYGAHHYQLVVFVVTQTCLGSPLYSLLKPVHNVVLLFANNSASNLARHVKNAFFLSSDTREYLGRIFAHAEKNKSTVVLKINSVATSAIHRSVLAFSGVEGLFCRKETANMEDNKDDDDDDDDDNNHKEKVEEKEEEESEKEGREGERKKVGGRRRLRRPRPASIPRFCTVYPETKYREDMLRGSRRRRVRQDDDPNGTDGQPNRKKRGFAREDVGMK